jgi:hypothetical protein
MDVYSYEDRLRREAAAAEDVAIRGRAESASKINYENAFKQSLLRAQENSPLDSVMETARKYEVNGDQANADKYTNMGMAILKQYVDAEVETLTGNKATPEMFKNILLAGGTSGVERGVTEKGANIRAAQQLPVQKLQADTSAGNLALARKKDAEEQGGGGKEDIDRWIKLVADAINFLEPISRGDNPVTMPYQEPAGYMSSKLNEIQMRLNDGVPPTKEDKKTISESRDLKNLVSKYKNQRLVGQSRGPGSATDIAETGQVEVDLNKAREERMGQPAVQPTMPPVSPMPKASVHPVGEIRFSPEDNASYIWDGEKWLLSKRQ